jgi:Mor family transcriptional regulator
VSAVTPPTDALRHEFLADVAEAAQRTAAECGIDQAVAEQIGCAVADMLCTEYAGIRIYINLDLAYRLSPRDIEICALQARGEPIAQLAKRFHLSEERIRQIIKRRNVRDPNFGQTGLFDATPPATTKS